MNRSRTFTLWSSSSIKVVLFIFLFLFGCNHLPPENDRWAPKLTHDDEYNKVLSECTRKDRQYFGFYQSYEINATIINAQMNSALLEKKRSIYQWDEKTLQQEREKSLQSMRNQASFLFSFFTPERDYNDLNKGTSIWKIYLEVGGHRFEGKVKKRNEKAIDITTLFPYHTRWSTAYRVDFDVPTSTLENAKPELVFTSSLGTSRFVFAPSL